MFYRDQTQVFGRCLSPLSHLLVLMGHLRHCHLWLRIPVYRVQKFMVRWAWPSLASVAVLPNTLELLWSSLLTHSHRSQTSSRNSGTQCPDCLTQKSSQWFWAIVSSVPMCSAHIWATLSLNPGQQHDQDVLLTPSIQWGGSKQPYGVDKALNNEACKAKADELVTRTMSSSRKEEFTRLDSSEKL